MDGRVVMSSGRVLEFMAGIVKSWVRVLLPLKFCRIKERMHFKPSVEQNSYLVWNFGECGASSCVVFIT
ncbi:hypothetical protein TNCV_1627121 [Trichonephila clavipes]|nr:hypothetical protein TNCV_1627121 [Trichonephila clavipes]